VKLSRTYRLRLAILFGLFGLIYALIVVPNHYFFRTSALDLGIYTHALYEYAHLNWADSEVYEEVPRNLFSDHLDLFIPLFSPLHWLLGTYTLLIIQLFAILFGAWGVFRYFQRDHPQIAILASLYFLSFFGVFGALSFDYHSNVVAACLMPWFFFWVRERRWKQATLVFFLILIAKENMSVWMCFVCLGLSLNYWKRPIMRNRLLLGSAVAAFYFYLAIGWVIPSIAPDRSYLHFDFTALGSGPAEVIAYIIQHPIDTLTIVFSNHINHPLGDYIKLETWLSLCFVGLPILLRKPQYLLMLAPIFAQKMLNDDMAKWGVNIHYNIEFAPILAIGIFDILSSRRALLWKKWAVVLVAFFSVITTIRTLDRTLVRIDRSTMRFYQSKHYRRNFDVEEVYRTMKLIPSEAVVSAQFHFLPHLSMREDIYQFPILRDAEYILCSKAANSYPLDEEEFVEKLEDLKASGHWQVQKESDEILLLKRKYP
jgi:uncharacterized membrane protein